MAARWSRGGLEIEKEVSNAKTRTRLAKADGDMAIIRYAPDLGINLEQN